MEFFGRIEQLVSGLGPQLGLFALLGLIVLLVSLSILTITRSRKALLLCLVLCMPFAGFVVSSVDAAATLLRWLIIFFLAASGIHGLRSPGGSNLWLGVFGVVTLVAAVFSPYPLVALQFSLLWITLTWLVAASWASEIRRVEDIHAFIKILLVGAGLYVLLAITQLPTFRGGTRFAGTSTGAPVFVITGGLLMPVALWTVLYLKEKRWRNFALFLTVAIATLLAFSGQRTGTYAGVIACVPIVWRFTPRSIAVTSFGLTMVVIAIWVVAVLFPEQTEFAVKRYSSLDVTGRGVRWRQGWEICSQTPFFPHGVKPHVDFHNAYFEAWFRGGLQGLIIILCAQVTLGWQSWKLIRSRRHQEFSAIGRLTFGILLFVVASSLPEDKLISPSNMTIFMTVLFGVIASRANALLARERAQLRAERLQQPAAVEA